MTATTVQNWIFIIAIQNNFEQTILKVRWEARLLAVI